MVYAFDEFINIQDNDLQRVKKIFYDNNIQVIDQSFYELLKTNFIHKTDIWNNFNQNELIKNYLSNQKALTEKALNGDTEAFREFYEFLVNDTLERLKFKIVQASEERDFERDKKLIEKIDIEKYSQIYPFFKDMVELYKAYLENPVKIENEQKKVILRRPVVEWLKTPTADEVEQLFAYLKNGYKSESFLFYYVLLPFYNALKEYQNFLENYKFQISVPKVKEGKLSFKVKPECKEAVRNIILKLSQSIELIDELQTNVNYAIDVFLSDDLESFSQAIHIGCETTQFVYFLDKIRNCFHSLTFINIERSKLFVTKEGKLLTASNISATKSKIKFVGPKKQEIIDKVIKTFI